jgi:hypothetical protein
MYEDLTALVDQGLNQVLDRQDEILDALRNGNGQVNGNGNGQGNGNGYNNEPIGVVTPPKDEPNYYCDDCGFKPLVPGQPRCPGCRREQDWNGVAVPLDLDKSGL